jgi:hypothetical protein
MELIPTYKWLIVKTCLRQCVELPLISKVVWVIYFFILRQKVNTPTQRCVRTKGRCASNAPHRHVKSNKKTWTPPMDNPPNHLTQPTNQPTKDNPKPPKTPSANKLSFPIPSNFHSIPSTKHVHVTEVWSKPLRRALAKEALISTYVTTLAHATLVYKMRSSQLRCSTLDSCHLFLVEHPYCCT